MPKPSYDVTKNYYHLLGVPPNATEDEIREAFRRRAREFHPDQNPEHPDWAEEQFKELNEAYQILSESSLRRAYDQARWREVVKERQQQAQQQPSAPAWTRKPVVSPQTSAYVRQAALWLWVVPLAMVLILVIVGILVTIFFSSDDDDSVSDAATATPHPTIEIAENLLPQMPVSRNADWQPVMQEVDGIEMVLVPSGCFVMGEEPPNEVAREQQRVCFDDPFWMDRTEVTNAQYLTLIREQVDPDATCESKWCEDDRPRESISWEDALAFCQLRGGSLPTAAQWEYAARGPDNWLYPWGNEFDPSLVIFRDVFEQAGEGASRPETFPVSSRPGNVSWVGALDLLGNVHEWIADSSNPNPSPRARYARGGSALNNELSITAEVGFSTLVRLTDFDGFRCVRG